jgi:hypothetical protein
MLNVDGTHQFPVCSFYVNLWHKNLMNIMTATEGLFGSSEDSGVEVPSLHVASRECRTELERKES